MSRSPRRPAAACAGASPSPAALSTHGAGCRWSRTTTGSAPPSWRTFEPAASAAQACANGALRSAHAQTRQMTACTTGGPRSRQPPWHGRTLVAALVWQSSPSAHTLPGTWQRQTPTSVPPGAIAQSISTDHHGVGTSKESTKLQDQLLAEIREPTLTYLL